ncbi:HAD family phosphatase [Microbulbifer magnicolonia]|uniref:HAD family hydrolase n=1 Tax=Microbulbifer magnicolonia TaxID=3109744 RepID=UPI002B401C6A|nr:HAD family phosphatase [Microbulbifer sp. GG15]
MNADIEVVLFDLGGVLVDLKPSPLPPEWLQDHLQFGIAAWFGSETAQRFERGEITGDEFARQLKIDLGLKVSTAEILREFTQWPIGLCEGAHELLLELQKTHRLAALTNTNALHWPRLLNEFRLSRYFGEIFASHQMALAKPDPRAFRHVVDRLKVPPERVIFFDDNLTNVNAARQLGIHGLQACSLDQVKNHLQAIGLLTD